MVASSTWGNVLYEVKESGSARFAGGYCSGLRTEVEGRLLTAPTDGSEVSVRIGWASSKSTVSITEWCSLSAGSVDATAYLPTYAPTREPSAEPTPRPTPRPTRRPTPEPTHTTSSVASAFARYSGYAGNFSRASGTVSVVLTSSGTQTLTYTLSDVDERCFRAEGAAQGVANSCGIHLHWGAGMTYSADCAAPVGGHFFVGDVSQDPWGTATYAALAGSVEVHTGGSSVAGLAVVVHDLSGARIACAVLFALSDAPAMAPTPLPFPQPSYAPTRAVSSAAPTREPTPRDHHQGDSRVASCESDEPGYDLMKALDSKLVFHWSLSEAGSLRALLVSRDAGWVKGGRRSQHTVSIENSTCGVGGEWGESGVSARGYDGEWFWRAYVDTVASYTLELSIVPESGGPRNVPLQLLESIH